jgi:hypothetical protein
VSVETFPAAPVNTFRRRVGQNKKNSEKGRRFIAVVNRQKSENMLALDRLYILRKSERGSIGTPTNAKRIVTFGGRSAYYPSRTTR